MTRRRLLGLAVGLLLAITLTGCSLGSAAVKLIANTATGGGTVWDANNIVSDEVFFNPETMAAADIQAFLDEHGCATMGCLGRQAYAWPGATVAWCKPVPPGSGTFALMLSVITKACGINPQVALVMIVKESGGISKDPVPAALTGFDCPDKASGGPNCSASVAGVWNQTWGMVQAFAHVKADPSRLNYPVGVAKDVMWNEAYTGCGASPVTPANTATALLYTYTPYQPNQASLDAFPGTGDKCSAYGNRNFFRYFNQYFGPTGGGKGPTGGTTVLANGVNVPVPNNQFVVPEELRGKNIQAPNEQVAKGLAAGFSKLGLPYVWGGGGSGAAENNGCSRGGGALNSCGSEIGFDCSGLTAYVMMQGTGQMIPGDSGSQRSEGTDIPWGQGLAGDIIGFPGHVAMFLGNIDGNPYILEASTVGVPVHIVKLTRSGHDAAMHRFWSGSVSQ